MTAYAIGDIQGCYEPLQRLLRQINFEPGRDLLYSVGDLVNRGPESLKVLRFFYRWRDSMRIVLGNHDLYLLARACGLPASAKDDTLQQVLAAPDREQLLCWLRGQPLLRRHRDYLMVHAGIPPQWSVTEARARAAEVARILRSSSWRGALTRLFQLPDQESHDADERLDRLRMTVDSLTRMRRCSADGKLELHMSPAEIAGTENSLYPWFQHRTKHPRKLQILFGHWAALQGKTDDAQIHGLDTGCVWGGSLRIMRLTDRALFEYKCPQC